MDQSHLYTLPNTRKVKKGNVKTEEEGTKTNKKFPVDLYHRYNVKETIIVIK